MSSVSDLLERMRKLGIQISHDGERLKLNAPKGAVTPELRDEISANKEHILLMLQEEQRETSIDLPQLKPYPRNGHIPLSFSQQRIWFLAQLSQDHSPYVVTISHRLDCHVDENILSRCLQAITNRHEILRTNFVLTGDIPNQQILPSITIPLEIVDLTGFTKELQDKKLQGLIHEEIRKPFDLNHGPLIRVLLARLNWDEDFLFITLHHIISDGFSQKIFDRDFNFYYSAYSEGKNQELPNLKVQYADYAIWQKELLQGKLIEKQLDYWRKNLAGDLPRLNLPVDFPWPDELDPKAGNCSISLSEGLSKSIVEFATKSGVTVFQFFLTGFFILLYRLTGQEDILLGTPVWGRTQPELEDLIGLFLNTLVLRINLSENPSFESLLQQVCNTSLDAFANQEIPFERLVEELQPERSINRNPIFDVLVNFLPQDLSRKGKEVNWEDGEEAKLPITFYIHQAAERLQLNLRYQLCLFEPGHMDIIMEQYCFLLEQILQNSRKAIGAYSLVTSAGEKVLPDPVAAIEQVPQVLVSTLISLQADLQPEGLAVHWDGKHWTYSQLLQSVDILSGAMLQHGFLPGQIVGIKGWKSYGLVTAMLAILRSGGILLMLDPLLPPLREEMMLREVEVDWIIDVMSAQSEAALIASHSVQPTLISVNPQTGSVDDGYNQNQSLFPLPEISLDAPAYIFFTSGTTGVPKAVVGLQKGLSHFIRWQIETFNIGPADRSAQLTNLSFDVVLRDIFSPLAAGACLCIPPQSVQADFKKQLEWMQAEEITMLHTVPAIVQNWLGIADTGFQLNTLRRVFFAGEPLTDTVVKQWRTHLTPDAQIINLYGPTETTLAKFYFCVAQEPEPGVQPVGQPLPQTQGLILNGHGLLCGIGEPGEIWVRTPYRTGGYMNNTEEQKKRFLPNPFTADPADILYRTGDLGKYRLDGLIEILGRSDDQVKIHGVRIEPGEVTAVLLEHSALQAAAVNVWKDEHTPFLAAYLVTKDRNPIDISLIRQYLTERLPTVLVPSTYTFLDHLPLTPNGKIDRDALPVPSRSMDVYTATQPRNVIEARLAQIWRELLPGRSIGVEDDFFALGGHSMLAVKMIIQIYETFGIQMPLTVLFKGSTIKYLADWIQKALHGKSWSSLIEIQPLGNCPPCFFIHGLTGDVFWFGGLVEFINPDQHLFVLKSRGLYGISNPIRTIEEMAALYIREIRGIQPTGPYFISGYSFGGSVAYEMACQLEEQGQEVGLLAILDHSTPKSGYYRYKLSPSFFWHILKILPHRFADFSRLRPDQMAARISRKSRIFLNSIKMGLSVIKRPTQNIQAGDLIDGADHLPDHVKKIIEANYSAIQEYTPRKFHGTLTLIKASGERFLVSNDPMMGWGGLADKVMVHVIPGSHLRIFQKPHIAQLGKTIQNCLDEDQKQPGTVR